MLCLAALLLAGFAMPSLAQQRAPAAAQAAMQTGAQPAQQATTPQAATPPPGLQDNRIVVLSGDATEYPLTPYIYDTRDQSGDISARQIVVRHQNNLRGMRTTEDVVNLSFDPVPHWLVFDLENRTRQSDWILQFGGFKEGRTGLAHRFMVYDGRTGETIIDGLNQGGQPMFQSADAHISLQPGQRTTIAVYVIPSDQIPLIITPTLVAAGTQTQQWFNTAEFAQDGMFVFFAGITMFFFGMLFLRKGIGFFPHLLLAALITVAYQIESTTLIVNIPGSMHLPALILGLMALLTLAVTQSILAASDNEAGDSLVLYICASFVLVMLMIVVFILPVGSHIRPIATYLIAGLALMIAAGKAFSAKGAASKAGIPAGLAWLMMAVGYGVHMLCAFGILPLMPWFIQANWIAMVPAMILLIFSAAGYVHVIQDGMIQEVLRKLQRAQSMAKLKQSKESADQARLLRVIEREREIMEELRAREALRTEEMRDAKIAADEANRAKSAFLAVVSHEIRTPMTGIMGMLRLIMDTSLSREQRDYAQTIQDSGEAMLALLNDILDFSKIEGAGMELEIIDFDLHRLINSVAMLMNGHAAQKGLSLVTKIHPDVPLYVRGDPTRLRQVLLNLVGNAIKFTPSGRVTIHLHLNPDYHGEQDADGPRVPLYFAVEDTGIGISEEAQKNLFNPFSQANSSIARKFGGTGLGLAISKRLIEAMGSDIHLSSIESKGTTFYFMLAVEPGSQEEAEKLSGASVQREDLAPVVPLEVLVVDDNAINRKVLEGLMTRDGHYVVQASSAAEAFEFLATRTIDVVFMDIEMPEMDGVEATARIRGFDDPYASSVPIVALTGNVSQEDADRYTTAGMDGVLGKPVEPERLRAILRAVGEQRGNRPPRSRQSAYAEADLDEDSFAVSMDMDRSLIGAGNNGGGAIAFEQPGEQPGGQQGSGEASAPVVHAPANAVALDTSMLTSLVGTIDKNSILEMVASLREKNTELLQAMRDALATGDMEALRARAHEMKGMCSNFGLNALAAAASRIEHGLRHGGIDAGALEDLVLNAVPEANEDAEAALNTWLAGLN